MRIIKFRGYCEMCRKMYPLCELDYRAWNNGLEASCNRHTVYTEVILREWTGLLDKNGVEIYEGSILQGSDTSPKYEVVIHCGGWGASFRHQGNGGVIQIYTREKMFEIIGNIDENPDLVKI